MSDSLRLHGLQHTRPHCPPPDPGTLSNSYSLNQWCNLIISSSATTLFYFFSTRVFFNELAIHIRWPKYWSFSFSISASNEDSGLISFKINWCELLAVQWTLRSLPQHHSSEASILCHSAFFIVQLSYPYTTTGKTIALILVPTGQKGNLDAENCLNYMKTVPIHDQYLPFTNIDNEISRQSALIFSIVGIKCRIGSWLFAYFQ